MARKEMGDSEIRGQIDVLHILSIQSKQQLIWPCLFAFFLQIWVLTKKMVPIVKVSDISFSTFGGYKVWQTTNFTCPNPIGHKFAPFFWSFALMIGSKLKINNIKHSSNINSRKFQNSTINTLWFIGQRSLVLLFHQLRYSSVTLPSVIMYMELIF